VALSAAPPTRGWHLSPTRRSRNVGSNCAGANRSGLRLRRRKQPRDRCRPPWSQSPPGCAYYGDVSAIRLLGAGASLRSLGDNLDLNGAAFHGHWRLCEFLIEQGADVNRPLKPRGETPLHHAAAFGTEETIQALLDAGAPKDARDIKGDSPLGWASWHLRPAPILLKYCFADFSIHPGYGSGLQAHLLEIPGL
jgi:hypothetical protein